MKQFEVGRSYRPRDCSYDPVMVISRTDKSILVRGGSGNIWRMFVKRDHRGCEFVRDSSVPLAWRYVFTYYADDPA